jgi:3-oxo-5alpha-steroid 4-dehydrogenase
LVVDHTTMRLVRSQIHSATRLRTRPLRQVLNGGANHVIFPRLFGSINLYLNRVCAPSLESLARRCDIPADRLRACIDRYNGSARSGEPDWMGKPPELVRPIDAPPFAAVPCHLNSVLLPARCITLGGLDVDGDQRVRRADGTTIPGLFAVGRCAAGVA